MDEVTDKQASVTGVRPWKVELPWLSLIRLGNGLVAAAIVGGLSVLYVIAHMAAVEYGQWPYYSNPESWSSPPMSRYADLFRFLLDFYYSRLVPASLISFFAAIVSIGCTVYSRKVNVAAILADLAILAVCLFFLLDPYGTMNWFLD